MARTSTLPIVTRMGGSDTVDVGADVWSLGKPEAGTPGGRIALVGVSMEAGVGVFPALTTAGGLDRLGYGSTVARP